MKPENSDDVIVTFADIIPAGYCAPGAEAFCKRHGLDWREMAKHGISASRLRACNDALVEKLIAQAEKRIKGEHLG